MDYILIYSVVLSRENTIIKKGFTFVEIILYSNKMKTNNVFREAFNKKTRFFGAKWHNHSDSQTMPENG